MVNSVWKRCFCALFGGGVFSGLVFFLGIPSFCQSQNRLEDRCGWNLESQEAVKKVYGPELAALNLTAGEVVADVGAGNGVRMCMFAMLYDSLTLYVEDIDAECLDSIVFAGLRKTYEAMNGGAFSCNFHLVLGTAHETLLPEGIFDKVMVSASYHHFSDPETMLNDIRSKLKPNGRIYLIENVVRRSGQHRRRLCDDPLRSEQELKQEFESQGFEIEAVLELGRWWTKMFVLKNPN